MRDVHRRSRTATVRRAWLTLAFSACAVAFAWQPAKAAAPTDPSSQPTVVRNPADAIVTGRGDLDGYHLAIARASDGWQWRQLATLDPAPQVDDDWMGAQCLTGDGRYVVAVVAPHAASLHEPGVDAGGLAYVVDAATGSVRAALGNVALTYWDPACGVGDRAVLTTFRGADEADTTLTVVDASSSSPVAAYRESGEITNAVPTAGGVEAARGDSIVAVDGLGTRTLAAGLPGTPFDLHPNDRGGVDFLVADRAHQAATAWQLAAGNALRSLGQGPLQDTNLFLGRAGHNTVVGIEGLDLSGTDLRAVPRPGGAPPVAVSLDGAALLSGAPHGAVPGSDVSGPTSKSAGPGIPAATTLTDSLSGARLATQVPRDTGKRLSTPLPATVVSTSNGTTTTTTTATSSPAPNTTSPVCAVPRADPNYQVRQPSPAQVDWAIQEGVQALLNGTNGRPAGAWNMTVGADYDSSYDQAPLPAYSPSQDFPQPVLSGTSVGTPIPPQVMEGILAAESNWDQASFHAPRGAAGDPLVADYYGAQATMYDSINYNNADCGYGLAQITDYMTIANTSEPFSIKEKVAVDYAENAVAGMEILGTKWNQLYALGTTMNNGDPNVIENWYGALWAYNSGVNANDGMGNYGLGWFNNPINPRLTPNRHEFGSNSSDYSTPGMWPYQEQVLGFADYPLVNPDGSYMWKPATAVGDSLTIPPETQFCTAADHCTPNDKTGQFCGDAQSHCWWHWPTTWAQCVVTAACHDDFFTVTGGTAEPTVTNPVPPVCSTDSNVPVNSYIVGDVDQSNLQGPTSAPNVVGCPNPPSYPINYGMTVTDSTGKDVAYDSSGATSPPIAQIDWHQLGAGFGGHMFFTHDILPSDTTYKVTAHWKLAAPPWPNQQWTVKVFIPNEGAVDPNATYTLYDSPPPDPNDPTTANNHPKSWQFSIDQDGYNNQWVTLGTETLHAGAELQLSNDDLTMASQTPLDLGFDAVAFVPENLEYLGGTVMTTPKAYVIYWQPSGTTSPTYDDRIWQFLHDAPGLGTYSTVLPQYYMAVNGAPVYVSDSLAVQGRWTDTTPYPIPVSAPLACTVCGSQQTDSCGPNCADDGNIANEVRNALSANPSWTTDNNTVFIVVMGPHEAICEPAPSGVCSDNAGPKSGLCGYHSFGVGSSNIIYSVIAYPDASVTRCGAPADDPNGADDGGGINTTWHELAETITDPGAAGWCGASGISFGLCLNDSEIADKCEGLLDEETSNGHTYAIQPLWNNQFHDCDELSNPF